MAMETMAIVSVAMYPRPPLDQNKKVLIEISFRSSTMSTPILVVTPYYVVVMNELEGVGHCFAWQGTRPTGAGGFSMSTYYILE
jgi:hypothetical protein